MAKGQQASAWRQRGGGGSGGGRGASGSSRRGRSAQQQGDEDWGGPLDEGDDDDLEALLAEGERAQQMWMASRQELFAEASELREMQQAIAATH